MKRSAGGGDRTRGRRPLDIDDPELWRAVRRAPPSALALQRIAIRVKGHSRSSRWWARWKVWVAASSLLLVGGAAGATVASFVMERAARGREEQRDPGSQPPSRKALPIAARTETLQSLPEPIAAAGPTLTDRGRVTAAPSKASVRRPTAVKAGAPTRLALTTGSPAVPAAPPPATTTLPPEAEPMTPPATIAPEGVPALPSPSRREARLIRAALTALHHDRDAAAALALLDQHAIAFPRGTLRDEATLARVNSLRALGRDDELLALLAGRDLQRLPRGVELLLLRGELSMKKGQLPSAGRDFDAVLERGASDDLLARALYGRAAARARAGDLAGARGDLRQFLDRHPSAAQADEVRRTLGR